MATHIDSEDIKALPIATYNKDLRAKLKSGDLLFASGDYLISKAIKYATKSPWSHVGILFILENIDRILLLESVEDVGVRFAPLSKYLSDYEYGKPYEGQLVLARYNDINEKAVGELARCGIDKLARPYDKHEIAKILARVTLGIGKKKRDREYICSELVYECFSNAGKEFSYDNCGFISPENIWQDNNVSIFQRIL